MDPFFLQYQTQLESHQQHHHLHHYNNALTHLITTAAANQETNLPPGFRFHPTDEELITYYLLKKVLDSSFTGRAIAEVDLNKCEPWELPEKAKMGEKEWYFFSLRDRKYPTGLRTNRATEAGYWKATGKDREIHSSKTGSLVGMKKTLVFYRGRAPRGEKTNWVMHEYRLEGKFAYHYLSRSSKDEWVISRVFQKNGIGSGSISGTGSSAMSGGGGKKGRQSHRAEVGSPASVSLPALLDTSPYKGSSAIAGSSSTSAAVTTDGCSYDGIRKQHVSCFSTGTMNNNMNAAAAGLGSGGASLQPAVFPSLRSLEENLQLANFLLPGMHQSAGGGGGGAGDLVDLMGDWGGEVVVEEHKAAAINNGGRMGFTELDSMWSF